LYYGKSKEIDKVIQELIFRPKDLNATQARIFNIKYEIATNLAIH
jgi:hypothetical protein